jgi:hypothetical protein
MQKPINECANQSTIVDPPAAGKDRPLVAKDLPVPRQIIEPMIGQRVVIMRGEAMRPRSRQPSTPVPRG